MGSALSVRQGGGPQLRVRFRRLGWAAPHHDGLRRMGYGFTTAWDTLLPRQEGWRPRWSEWRP
jgi:hypothetical protein